MKTKISWKEKYIISISEYCSTKDIQRLLEVGSDKAREIKKKVELECISNKKPLYTTTKVPTEALLQYVNKSTAYYYQKMIDENKVVE